MKVAARSLISALIAIALVLSLTATQCVDCSAAAKASRVPAPCCNPDGHCKGSAGTNHPCLKTHAESPAVIEQTLQLTPAARHFELELVQQAASQYQQLEARYASQYSPPLLYLFHSAFLI